MHRGGAAKPGRAPSIFPLIFPIYHYPLPHFSLFRIDKIERLAVMASLSGFFFLAAGERSSGQLCYVENSVVSQLATNPLSCGAAMAWQV